jgi:ferrous iron transport protein A
MKLTFIFKTATLRASKGDSVTVSLNTVALHTRVVVRDIGGERGFRRRLMEMGLVPGTEVMITKIAPLGDPLELSVRGARLSVRRNEVETLLVDREPLASVA